MRGGCAVFAAAPDLLMRVFTHIQRDCVLRRFDVGFKGENV